MKLVVHHYHHFDDSTARSLLAAITSIVRKELKPMADTLDDIKTALDAVKTASQTAADEIKKLADKIAAANPVDEAARAALVQEATDIAANLNAAATAGG
jgi:hypothetical protein